MNQIITAAPAPKTPPHPRADAATAAGTTRPLPTVTQYDHVAAAAYLMKHADTTALIVTDVQTGQPAGIITQADIAHAIADGKDLNDARVHAVLATRPALTTTSVRDAATNMTARHFRHPPVTQSELGHLGLTPPQYSVMSVAAAEPGLSGAELASDCMLTPQTTNEIISLLAAAGGLLERAARASSHQSSGAPVATGPGPSGCSRCAQASTP
jgi:CBS domain